MPSIINASTSGGGGIVQSADASGVLALQSGGVTKLTISSAGVTGDVTGTATALSTASGSAPSYSARAWVNLDGTGTAAIRASGNVSSVTDGGTGTYTINFTTAMPDANYSWTAGAQRTTRDIKPSQDSGATRTTTALQIYTSDTNSTVQDAITLCVAVFR